jgi:hypothetical protein
VVVGENAVDMFKAKRDLSKRVTGNASGLCQKKNNQSMQVVPPLASNGKIHEHLMPQLPAMSICLVNITVKRRFATDTVVGVKQCIWIVSGHMTRLRTPKERDLPFATLPTVPLACRSLKRFGAYAFLPVVLIIAVSVVARLPALMTTSIDADEGVYLVMAQQWLQGGLPYIAVWDQHPPGLPALFALVLSIVADPILGVRLAAVAAVAITALTIRQFCIRYDHSHRAGLIGALIYIVCISRWAGLSANTEIFNNALVAFAAYHLLGAARRPPAIGRAFIAALAFGIGLQIKYVVFPESVLLSLAYLLESYRTMRSFRSTGVAAGVLIAGGCLPTLLAIAYFWSEGALSAFIDANIFSNLSYVSLVPSAPEILKDSASGLMPIAGCLAVLLFVSWRYRHKLSRSHVELSMEAWIALWIVAAFLDVCLPMKFFRHHFFALYPPVCLAASLCLQAIGKERRRISLYGFLAVLLTAIPPWAFGVIRAAPWSATDVPRTIAALLRDAGANDGEVYVYRYQPAVYALAQLRPPTPYVMTLEMEEFSESAHLNGVAEMRRIMHGQPRFIVKATGMTGGRAMAIEDVLLANLAHYRLIRTFPDQADRSLIELYERAR